MLVGSNRRCAERYFELGGTAAGILAGARRGGNGERGARALQHTHGGSEDVPVYARDTPSPGMRIAAPAIAAESQATTVVARGFDARIDGQGYIILERRATPTVQ